MITKLWNDKVITLYTIGGTKLASLFYKAIWEHVIILKNINTFLPRSPSEGYYLLKEKHLDKIVFILALSIQIRNLK